MVILSPEGQSTERLNELAPRRFKSLDGVTLGLLGNTKLNADEVLEALGDLLGTQFSLESVVMRTKPTFSRPAPEELINELVEKCDVVITGVGD
jgi:hypothetical protein